MGRQLISLKAKGLYSLIQSLITIPGMDLCIWKIKAKCKEKDKAFESFWIELKKNGYLKQYRIPSGAKGAFKYEYDLLFEPDLKTSSVINLDKDGNIASPKGTSQEEDCVQEPNTDSNPAPDLTDFDHTPPFWTQCFMHSVLNRSCNSNTQSGNILSVTLPPKGADRSTDKTRSIILYQIEYDWIEEVTRMILR